MATWTANKITADSASKIQVGAGILVNKFTVSAPAEPADENIICDTTGDFHITCTPEWRDLMEGVNNAKMHTKEGMRIRDWNCALGITSLTATEESLKMMIAAADGTATNGIRGRQIQTSDFTTLYWLGDMQDPNKLFVVEMSDAVNTSGIDFTATDDGKGGFALTIIPHASSADPEKVPMAFYILTKQ